MGISFDCPGHRDVYCRLAVMFANPVDGGESYGVQYQWQRTGDTFETLSLTPSVNVPDHWHGHVTNGDVT